MWVALQSLGSQENEVLAFLRKLDHLCNVGHVPCMVQQFVLAIRFDPENIS